MSKENQENRNLELKVVGIAGSTNALWQKGDPIPKVFQGEFMECCICKTTEKSDSAIESQWNCIQDEDTGRIVYLCPECFSQKGNITKAMQILFPPRPTRLVLFQGESSKEFPLTAALLKDVLRTLKKKRIEVKDGSY